MSASSAPPPASVIIDPAKLAAAQIMAGTITANQINASTLHGHKVVSPQQWASFATGYIPTTSRTYAFKSTEVWLFVVCAVFWGMFGGLAARMVTHRYGDWVLFVGFIAMGLMFLVVQLIVFRLNSQNKFLVVDHAIATGQRP